MSAETAGVRRFTDRGVWRYCGDLRLYVDLGQNLERRGELARAGASHQKARCVDRNDTRALQGLAPIGAESGRNP